MSTKRVYIFPILILFSFHVLFASEGIAISKSIICAPTVDAGSDQVLSCTSSIATLTAGPTSAITPSYSWVDPSGFEVGSNPIVQVNFAGIYTLIITDTNNGCAASDDVIVSENYTSPNIVVTSPDIIDCANPIVTIDASASTGSQLSYTWSGPNAFSMTGPIVDVDLSGGYSVVVTDGVNGCTSSEYVSVLEDTSEPGAFIQGGGMLTCSQTFVTLTGSSVGSNVTYSWTGPNNFTSTAPSPSVNEPGSYTLIVTDNNNSCESESTIVVTANTDIPNIYISTSSDDVITCLNPMVEIWASADFPDVTYLWTGPNNFSSTSDFITVTSGGVYNVEVTDSNNGCTNLMGVNIAEDISYPTAEAGSNQTIICTASSATLGGGGTSSGPTIEYVWEGPNGYMANVPNPIVSEAGIYTLEVHNTSNGCSAFDEVEIVCSCIEYLNITGNPIPSGTYKAVYDVESASLVPVNGSVIFQAGDMVKLAPGFEIKANASFTAKIEVCQ